MANRELFEEILRVFPGITRDADPRLWSAALELRKQAYTLPRSEGYHEGDVLVAIPDWHLEPGGEEEYFSSYLTWLRQVDGYQGPGDSIHWIAVRTEDGRAISARAIPYGGPYENANGDIW